MWMNVKKIEKKESLCKCGQCNYLIWVYDRRGNLENADTQFDLSCFEYRFEFAKIVWKEDDRDAEPPVDLLRIINFFKEMSENKEVAKNDELALDIMKFITYSNKVTVGNLNTIEIVSLLELLDHLEMYDLNELIPDEKTAKDFLRKILMIFVYSWYAFQCINKETDGDRHEMAQPAMALSTTMRFLTNILAFPKIAEVALEVVTSDKYWHLIGPMDIIEEELDRILCKKWLLLFNNLFRIEGFVKELEGTTEMVAIFREYLPLYIMGMGKMHPPSCYEDIGIHMQVLTSLASSEGFARMILGAQGKPFVQFYIVGGLDYWLTDEKIYVCAIRLLKNLCMTARGADLFLKDDHALGCILAPIIGPNELTPEEMEGLPTVAQCPPNPERTQNLEIKHAVLDIIISLCRYRKQREAVRLKKVYNVLKHFHLVEKDEGVLEKIEHVVNILIREEGTEIPFDDLMAGLQIDGAASSGQEGSTPAPDEDDDEEEVPLGAEAELDLDDEMNENPRNSTRVRRRIERFGYYKMNGEAL